MKAVAFLSPLPWSGSLGMRDSRAGQDASKTTDSATSFAEAKGAVDRTADSGSAGHLYDVWIVPGYVQPAATQTYLRGPVPILPSTFSPRSTMISPMPVVMRSSGPYDDCLTDFTVKGYRERGTATGPREPSCQPEGIRLVVRLSLAFWKAPWIPCAYPAGLTGTALARSGVLPWSPAITPSIRRRKALGTWAGCGSSPHRGLHVNTVSRSRWR